MKKNLISLLLLTLITNCKARIISNKESNLYSLVAGMALGLSAGAIFKELSYNERWVDLLKMNYLSKERNNILSVSLITSLIAALITKYFTYKKTPSSILSKIKEKIKKHETLEITKSDYTNKNSEIFLKNIEEIYSTSNFPLAIAFHQFENFYEESMEIRDKLIKILEVEDISKEIKSEALKLLINYNEAHFNEMKKAMKILKNQPSFLNECVIYKQCDIEKKIASMPTDVEWFLLQHGPHHIAINNRK